MLFAAPENKHICKIIEASEIALKRPSLKEQIESKKLLLFVTVSYENVITFNCNYVYIKYFNHHFNFCVRKPFIIVPTMRYCKKLLLTFEIVVILISSIFYMIISNKVFFGRNKGLPKNAPERYQNLSKEK